MSGLFCIRLGSPALLEFSGPDAVRFLNGQLTQDVRRVAGGKISLPACVTDAKGKLQFRVNLLDAPGGVLWIAGEEWESEALEARLTRYLIADDVEVRDLSGAFQLVHFTGPVADAPEGVIAREADRFGSPGVDWWIPADMAAELPDVPELLGEMLEAFRIQRGVPRWGVDLVAGQLPPEAGLDATDISYHKGCYIGQEVISRIKSAGKVNKSLVRLLLPAGCEFPPGPLTTEDGSAAGEITSVSPFVEGGRRAALGYLKRGADVSGLGAVAADGKRHAVTVAG